MKAMVALSLSTLSVGLAGCGTADLATTGSQPAAASGIDPASFTSYPLFSAGPAALGYNLTAVSPERRRPSAMEQSQGITRWANDVTFIYGQPPCTTSEDEGGCEAGPVQVQVWPSCDRNLAMYHRALATHPLHGARYAFTGDATLEVYTGKIAVVVFGPSNRADLRVAAGLVPANAAAERMVKGLPAGTLPPPAPGALQGRIACTHQ